MGPHIAARALPTFLLSLFPTFVPVSAGDVPPATIVESGSNNTVAGGEFHIVRKPVSLSAMKMED